jgi:hypothetical protein
MTRLETVLKRFEEPDEVSGPAWVRRARTSSTLGCFSPAVPPLRWITARSTNSAPALFFTFHLVTRHTSRCTFSAQTITQTSSHAAVQ